MPQTPDAANWGRDCLEHCVRESIEKGEGADEKIEELTAAVERFLRV